jgi:hypothetical protein
MAEYEAGALIFDEHSRLIEVGERFRSDRVPGKNWLPVDDEAKAAVDARFGKNGPVVTSLERQPATSLVAEIPDDWRDLHHLRRVQIAKQIRPDLAARDDKTISEVADEVIATEVARRSAANAMPRAPAA